MCIIHVILFSPSLYPSFLLLFPLPSSFLSLFSDHNLEAGEEETESGDEDDVEGMCPQGEHEWATERCLICQYCKYCTGYGPSCCNEGMPGRDPGG